MIVCRSSDDVKRYLDYRFRVRKRFPVHEPEGEELAKLKAQAAAAAAAAAETENADLQWGSGPYTKYQIELSFFKLRALGPAERGPRRQRQSIEAAEQERDKATEAQPQSNAEDPTMLRKEMQEKDRVMVNLLQCHDELQAKLKQVSDQLAEEQRGGQERMRVAKEAEKNLQGQIQSQNTELGKALDRAKEKAREWRDAQKQLSSNRGLLKQRDTEVKNLKERLKAAEQQQSGNLGKGAKDAGVAAAHERELEEIKKLLKEKEATIKSLLGKQDQRAGEVADLRKERDGLLKQVTSQSDKARQAIETEKQAAETEAAKRQKPELELWDVKQQLNKLRDQEKGWTNETVGLQKKLEDAKNAAAKEAKGRADVEEDLKERLRASEKLVDELQDRVKDRLRRTGSLRQPGKWRGRERKGKSSGRRRSRNALKRKPQNPAVVIDACSHLIVDSGMLKENQDAIQEKLETVLGGRDPGNKNVANDVRKYLTYFLRGFVPVLLDDKEELTGRVLSNPKPVSSPKIGARLKKRKKIVGVEKAVGVDEGMLGGSTQPPAESVEKDREIAAAKLEADTLKQQLEESNGGLQNREETVKKLSQKVKRLKKELEEKETEAAPLQFQVKELDAFVKAYKRDIDRLKEELSTEKLRNVKIGLDLGHGQRPYVRALDFAIRAAVLAVSVEGTAGRLLYRPGYTLLTYALKLGLLRKVDIDVLHAWQDWDWDVKQVGQMCGKDSTKDEKVDAKFVMGALLGRHPLRGTDHPVLSKEEAESMEKQLQDLEELQGQKNYPRSSLYNGFLAWVTRSLEEYGLWNDERSYKKRQESSAGIQNETEEWYMLCKDSYLKSVTLKVGQVESVKRG
ncbi:hypothetical protein KFL_006580170 [Klebsormidium nitens]|uniref:Uncharacterized protein n=1 Tax=Klebsormidium nitens TaxID=105231 RepID=A0A1Y1IPM8_KLENI|nr:hypothetical protein KFL_006580170 [Klebsormidium nitens]|eukprot:GAQ90587.1 hypothetical protein KFL_006580170 [Klebsormidium nitens]